MNQKNFEWLIHHLKFLIDKKYTGGLQIQFIDGGFTYICPIHDRKRILIVKTKEKEEKK